MYFTCCDCKKKNGIKKKETKWISANCYRILKIIKVNRQNLQVRFFSEPVQHTNLTPYDVVHS